MKLARALLAAGLLASATPAFADEAAEAAAYRSAVQELLELTEAAKMGEQMGMAIFNSVMAGATQKNPEVPQRALEIVQQTAAEVFGSMMDDQEKLLDEFVPIYERHFSLADIQAMNDFYRTPVGRKMVEAMPSTVAEGAAVGQRLAEGLMPRFVETLNARLTAEGLSI